MSRQRRRDPDPIGTDRVIAIIIRAIEPTRIRMRTRRTHTAMDMALPATTPAIRPATPATPHRVSPSADTGVVEGTGAADTTGGTGAANSDSSNQARAKSPR